MFARADQLRIADIEERFPLHVIEYYWVEFEPNILVFDLEDGQLHRFDIAELDFSVSKRRICIGSFVDDEYVPCPENAEVERFTQCRECGESLIPVQECLFEPKCDGDLCESPLCRRGHAVYIAFFGDRPKVGMTLETRVRRRVIEQGADAYSVIGRFPGRKSAREFERMVANKLKITERPASASVLESLVMPRRKQMIESRWMTLGNRLRDGLGIEPEGLEFLEGYPISEPLGQVPELTACWGSHSGEAIGIKGKYLIYKSGRLSALRLSDLPARFLTTEML